MEEPIRKPDSDDEGMEEERETSPEPAGRKVPRPDKLEDKWFMTGRKREPAVAITVSDSEVPNPGARAGITGKILEAIEQLVEVFGGGVAPVVTGALATNSITIYLDDPIPTDDQAAFPVEFTLSAARQVQRLIDLDDDDLFTRALEVGPEAAKYVDFVHLLSSNDVRIEWQPRDSEPSTLGPERARRQYARLTVAPETREREMTLIGVLYRVIADPAKVEGSLGIKLSKDSPQVTSAHKSWANVIFQREQLASIKAVVGEAVEARVRFTEPIPGTGIATEPPRVGLTEIALRPKALTIEELLDDDEANA